MAVARSPYQKSSPTMVSTLLLTSQSSISIRHAIRHLLLPSSWGWRGCLFYSYCTSLVSYRTEGTSRADFSSFADSGCHQCRDTSLHPNSVGATPDRHHVNISCLQLVGEPGGRDTGRWSHGVVICLFSGVFCFLFLTTFFFPLYFFFPTKLCHFVRTPTLTYLPT